tara:strand:- start:475 stop:819 length:345 start_codon:yes stop_codon:yes gene_type:complete
MEKLDFETYSQKAWEMAMTSTSDESSLLPIFVMGLCGEAGEVSEKFKKLLRDSGGNMTEEFKQEVAKELGDVLWYINALSKKLDISLEEVAQANINKIESRRARNVQHGNGDNR